MFTLQELLEACYCNETENGGARIFEIPKNVLKREFNIDETRLK